MKTIGYLFLCDNFIIQVWLLSPNSMALHFAVLETNVAKIIVSIAGKFFFSGHFVKEYFLFLGDNTLKSHLKYFLLRMYSFTGCS